MTHKMGINSPRKPSSSFILFFLLLLITLLLTVTWVYWNGLDSRFILDDIPSLSSLAAINSYTESAQHQQYASIRFWLYVFDGTASSLGRPLSLLTFALQAHHWPTNPWAFKYVNLMLHLINGCLVILLCLQTTKLMKINSAQAATLSLITGACWLLHPIHTGTVFYAVQRMTELSALFTLAGLITYLHGRSLCLISSKHIKGLIWMSTGIMLGGTLGVLSKENAILLVVYVIVIEATLLHQLPKPPHWKIWRFLFLISPILLLLGYFALDIQGRLLDSYVLREFTITERLLTEPRILWEYILKIIAPRPSGFTLFHDNYQVSTSFTQPITTALSSASLLALIITAIYFRKQATVFSFAIFWFLGGHLLESTAIPLELYFDHRNYLPSLGILFAINYYLLKIICKSRKASYQYILILFIFIWLGLFSTITYNEANLWRNAKHQAITWLNENPGSKRARQNAASTYFELGEYQKTIALLTSISRDWPNDTGTYIQRMQISCLVPAYQYTPSEKLLQHLKNSHFDRGTLSALQEVTLLYEKSSCENQSYEIIVSVIDALLQNKAFLSQYKDFHFILGRLHAKQNLLKPAIKELDKSYKIKPDVYIAMHQAQWLASAELYNDALQYLEKAKKAASESILQKKLFTKIINEWKNDINNDKQRLLHQKK